MSKSYTMFNLFIVVLSVDIVVLKVDIVVVMMVLGGGVVLSSFYGILQFNVHKSVSCFVIKYWCVLLCVGGGSCMNNWYSFYDSEMLKTLDDP